VPPEAPFEGMLGKNGYLTANLLLVNPFTKHKRNN
jgi:hypothetical protein